MLCLPVPALDHPAFTCSPSTTTPPSPTQQTWPVDNTKVDTYTGSSETELLSKLTEHLPPAGSPNACPTPGGSETTGAGSSGEGSGRDPGSNNDKGVPQEERFDGVDSIALAAAEALIDAFDKNVDVARLLRDIRHHPATAGRGSSPSSAPPPLPPAGTTVDVVGSGCGQSPVIASVSDVEQLGSKSGAAVGRGGNDSSPSVGATAKPATSSSRKSREEVEAEAAEQGASGG